MPTMSTVTELTTTASEELLPAAGCVLTALGNAAAAVWDAGTSLGVALIHSLMLMCRAVIYLLLAVPYPVLYCVTRILALLKELLVGVVFLCAAGCEAAAAGVRLFLFVVLDCLPALTGALLPLLAVLGLWQLVSTHGLPVEQLQTAAAWLRDSWLAAVRLGQKANRTIQYVYHTLRDNWPALVRLLRMAKGTICYVSDTLRDGWLAAVRLGRMVRRSPLDTLRAAVAACRRSAAVMFPAEDEPPPRAAPPFSDNAAACGGESAHSAAAGDQTRACVVCLDQDKAMILEPCRHVCVCEPCCRQVEASDGRCPLCRERISNAYRVFI